jgi:hypothetical protein
MKNISMLVLILLIPALVYTHTATAGEIISLSVSCTIPAIPGLNAPLIEEETVKTEADTPAESNPDAQKPPLPEASQTIQQDDQKKELSYQGQKSAVIVKTFYSR